MEMEKMFFMMDYFTIIKRYFLRNGLHKKHY